jgi:hypothetical protein
LEEKNASLAEQLVGSFFGTRDAVFLNATGFCSPAEAKKEMRETGCLAIFENQSRSHRWLALDNVNAIEDELLRCMPGCEDEIKAVAAELRGRSGQERTPQMKRGKKRVVDDEHLFLIPFLYVMGGFLEWQFELLPGFGVQQQHISELLHLSLPVVCSKWVPRYYRVPDRAWLRKYCAPIEGEPKVCFFCFFSFFLRFSSSATACCSLMGRSLIWRRVAGSGSNV